MARKHLRRWLAWIAWSALLVLATIVVGGALSARRRLPNLEPWHQLAHRDFQASDLTAQTTLKDYLALEETAFRRVREEIEARLEPQWKVPANRYNPEGRSYPGRLGTDWNRTQFLSPAGEAVGGALLIHGLTDSPYSMRTIGERLRGQGYHVVALRVPGHGTVPAGLTTVTWEDWLAAVRLGARSIQQTVGAGKPFVIVGYSNGGALALKYTLDAVEGSGDRLPSRVVLLSPMIGVQPFAWLTRVISMLGPIPAFEKARWLDIYPEYNPFKYTSFPANAGLQTWRITTTLQRQLTRIAEAGRAKEIPPLLTFQSIVDSTVSTPAVVHALYDVVADERSEVVVFDINRASGLAPFVRESEATLLSRLRDNSAKRYRRTLVTNANPDSLDVVARTAEPGATSVEARLLGIAWPRDVYSLSHIAVPFPMSDPVYGRDESAAVSELIRIGLLSPRGEKAVMSVPSDTLMRLTCNPFFSYMDERIVAWLGAPR